MITLTPGDRCITIDTHGNPASEQVAVTVVENYENTGDVLVQADHAERTNRVPRAHLRKVGCVGCENTGFLAERREGNRYVTPCPNCNEKTGHYWPKVRTYKLRVTV